MFRRLIIQSTFKIDSIPCNCVCIFKTFSEQYFLNYCIEKKKCSSFIETYRVFRERKKRVWQHFSTISMSGENVDVCPDGMHLIFWRPWTLFQHVWTERFNFSWHLINICLLHSHFCTSITFFLLLLPALSQNLSVHNTAKMSSPWQNAFTAFAGTLYWWFIYLFERLENERNSIILSMSFLYFKCLRKTMSCF